MISAFQIAFSEKDRGQRAPAKLLGRDRVQTRRNYGWCRMGQSSIQPSGTKFDPPIGSVPDFSQTTQKERFSAVILHLRHKENLSRKQIGKTAGVGPETVKAWERGRQVAQFEHIAHLGQRYRSVQRFAMRELGLDEWPEFLTPRLLNAVMAGAYQVLHQENPDGDELRAAWHEEQAQKYRGLNGPGGAKK